MSFDAIGIVCRDIPRTCAFYAMLGVEFVKIGESHFEATTPSGIRLMLDSVDLIKSLSPDWVEPRGSAIILCFKQDQTENVDRLYDRLIEDGAKSVRSPWDAFWGQRYASVLDPDGNQLDLFAEIERA